ncbi:UDP-N-acetylmuramoyl-L-alanyl-D-glutamate--2,6-diaminopimelate ligase [Breznakiella homolactica]|uniref:UDP-N-acetylmuramyl-tripeptide synthetase n=1 Tax=Breznakiella homolactica TaxID=2798577 RepID=A0A7T7XR13_9SPIR|nr:UDP-N-acetylmuramoyl-L-alanyl-D-glutamate--2,6-diaminopimelate ligase [Breznakiella homolactica]QQO10901.1 UDP-N-acetylmuramoyl-L-alanyl-D-glutamate--2,6-diaminopimelate ligase [Breznakiella homolactica]
MERRLSDFFTEDTARRAGLSGRQGSSDPLITGLEYDSRKIQPGSIYFALPGLHTDGHTYIPEAIRRGAAAVVHQDELPEYRDGTVYLRVQDSRFSMSPVSDAFYDFPSRHLAVIGVTGTEGKSTTVYLVFQLLRLAGKKAGFVSTVQYCTGDTVEWNPEHQTTPEATTVHRHLAEMRRNGLEYAVLESSSHGLSPKTNRLGDVAFDAGIMTNVTHEHLEFHGTWEQYREDKANLFRALDRFSHEKEIASSLRQIPAFGAANGDDPSAGYFAGATGKKTYTFSTRGKPADLSVISIESSSRGSSYRVRQADGAVLEIRDRLPGAFNAGNVLAALLTVSNMLDVPAADLIPLIPQLQPVRGRMTVIDRGQPFEVLVDYAHTPSSFETIYPPLRHRLNSGGGRIISVFGSAGERDTKKRPAQGRIAAEWSDMVVLCDEDPRGEVPMAILEEIAAGCLEAGEKMKKDATLFLIPGRPEAIRRAFSLARAGDLVLLLGKGHENSIIYAEKTVSYDEITEAETALAEMGYIQDSGKQKDG